MPQNRAYRRNREQAGAPRHHDLNRRRRFQPMEDIMNQRRLIVSVATAAVLVALIIAAGAPADAAHFGGFGRSAAGGSGGIATGSTGFTGSFGQSVAGGSGGRSTGFSDFRGMGASTGAGSGGMATGATNPMRPTFGGG